MDDRQAIQCPGVAGRPVGIRFGRRRERLFPTPFTARKRDIMVSISKLYNYITTYIDKVSVSNHTS